MVYLQDRAGDIHVWNRGPIDDRDPWERAMCGDPGDFNRLRSADIPGCNACRREITCPACRKALGMPTQQLDW